MKNFYWHEIYDCHYAISGYHSNEFSSTNIAMWKVKSGQSLLSVYRVYSVSIDNILMWILHKGDSLRLTIYLYYSWEMAFNIRLSSDRIYEWKIIRRKVGEVNNTKVYITNYETTRWIFDGCYISNWIKHRATKNELGEKKFVYFRNDYRHKDETIRKQQGNSISFR
jgi:hypothetical protein